MPSILGTSEDTIRDKQNFLKEILNLSQIDFIDLIDSFPSVLFLNKDSLKQKIKVIEKMGLPRDQISSYPHILTAPANKLLLRYAICKRAGITLEEFLSKNIFMINENKLFARLQILKDTNHVLRVARTEKVFVGHYGISTQELQEEFPLTEKIAQEYMRDYEDETSI